MTLYQDILDMQSINFETWMKSLPASTLEKLESAYANNNTTGHTIPLTKPYLAYHSDFVAIQDQIKSNWKTHPIKMASPSN